MGCLVISTESGDQIKLTPNHLIMAGNQTKVTSISSTMIRGVYCPLTSSGTLLVDNILTSCYASTDFYLTDPAKSDLFHSMANILFYPARMVPGLLDSQMSQNEEGTRTYPQPMKTVGKMIP